MGNSSGISVETIVNQGLGIFAGPGSNTGDKNTAI